MTGLTEPEGTGMGREGGEEQVRRSLPLPFLEVRGVGGHRHRRPSAYQEWQAHLLSLQVSERVLERATGEGVR